MEQSEMRRYSTILYDVKQKFGLSGDEYMLLDMVYQLSLRTGYCYKTPMKIGTDLGVSPESKDPEYRKRQVNRMIIRLSRKGLLERLNDRALRVTNLFVSAISMGGTSSPGTGHYVPLTEVAGVGHNVPSGTKRPKGGTKRPEKQIPRLTIEINNKELAKSFQDFCVMRKTNKRPLTTRAQQLVIQRLQKLYPDNESAQIACINQSVENGWQTVYELKEDKNHDHASIF